MTLVALAVAYPVFGVVSRSPEFFVARNSTLGNLLAIVAAICVGLPLLIAFVGFVASRIDVRLGTVVHYAAFGLLSMALFLPWVKRVEILGTLPILGLALLLGVAASIGHYRSATLRSYVSVLAVSIVIVPAVFLWNPGVRNAFVRVDVTLDAPEISKTPPIVFVVLDEFPLSSLLDENYQIDAGRYPNFAELAAGSYWFRNATSVSANTMYSVPAIVSGRYPLEPDAVPTLRYYPNNLFTMLRGAYDMTVFGRFLQLCPADECRHDLAMPGDTLGALIADLTVVYQHVLAPEAWVARLPPIAGDWLGFARQRRFHEEDGELLRNEQGSEFDRFIRTIDRTPDPSLYFLHTLLPHMPFHYVPSGKQYIAADYQRWQERGEDLFTLADAGQANALHQRHLLQVGFVDLLVGRLIDRLESLGIYDDALIIVTADHGTSFREGQRRRSLTEGNVGDIALVPLLVKLPGQEQGFVSDRKVEVVDIIPSIASVLSFEMPYPVHGRSLLDFDLPERASRSAVVRNATTIGFESIDGVVDNGYIGWERKLDEFGSGSNEGLFELGSWDDLVGKSVSSVAAGRRSRLLLEVSDLRDFDDVDLSADVLPLYIHGELHRGEPRPVELAIALNGIIAATTVSYMEHGRWTVASALSERYLQDGSNEVVAYLIGERRGAPNLRSMATQ